ncbi:PSD1 and planctomycete cytochrome C domain-containing protein [Stratiformator vulcanicus]|uniref:Planctomycete cytochrome C n=1 Tax=Stratiformator vulcanicus TaxID=2527980 RepID=A0A517R182_9PLAN|nr:PSD1 and planctomycete cytochrome C domain-containing protein [Stratiformator vulcanicus]QDT37638.1 Planctomycete cytochrome C [Stratiformator vulcanicus]
MLRALSIFALFVSSASLAMADVSFTSDVKPILARRCFACHGPDDAESGLALHERDSAFGEADSGLAAIVPGKPGESELIRRITSEDEFEKMPPEGDPVPAEEIATLRKWIAEGAKWEKHWAFRPLERPEIPEVQNTEQVANPIDAFILKRLEDSGLNPNPPADRAALLRRVYYDLTGLPPSPEEVEQFLENESPDAYEQVVDRLLASPRYGERWARHWLDVVRFAETNSFERDAPKPFAWKYRDYVIRSFNADKPYDQFVREQLAGDELDEVTPETVTATGYYRLGTYDDEPADKLLARYDQFDDLITTTGQGLLGLTLNCARCHDHKIDPIPATDYYGMLAFFRGLTPYARGKNPAINSLTDVSPKEVKAAYARLDNEERRLTREIVKIEERAIDEMPGPMQRATEGRKRKQVLDKHLGDYLNESEAEQYRSLVEHRESIRSQRRELPDREMVLSVAKCDATPEATHVLLRGSPQAEGDPVAPRFPEIFETALPELPEVEEGARSSGRRRVLAEWITSPDNRLTSRVMVNRIWQHHFGRGIVRSPNNFGQLGVPPTHPKLLDWLATEFVRRDWQMKPLHRLIVTSNTYRMSSAGSEEALKADPANDLFWRFNMQRLSAEEIRDSLFAINGRLNLKMYGPGFYPDISDEVMQGQSKPGEGWGDSSLKEQARRSIYIHVKRSLIPPLLANFDFPETDSSCEARFRTTQPGQALGLLNGEFVHREAGFFAKRLRDECGDKAHAQVARGLALVSGHEPSQDEIEAGLKLIDTLETEHGLTSDEALRLFCLSLYNRNEFIYLD